MRGRCDSWVSARNGNRGRSVGLWGAVSDCWRVVEPELDAGPRTGGRRAVRDVARGSVRADGDRALTSVVRCSSVQV